MKPRIEKWLRRWRLLLAAAGAFLCLSLILGGAFAVKLPAQEANDKGTVGAEPSEAQSLRRLAALEKAAGAYFKLPYPEKRETFLKAARECLWDGKKETVQRAIDLLMACGSYYSREELLAFRREFEKLDRKDREGHRDAYIRCFQSLLETDLRGTFDFRSKDNIQYEKRSPEDKVLFLRATYWAHCSHAQTSEWIVRNLAVINHDLTRDALLDIQKYVAWLIKSKNMGGWWHIELQPLIERALRLNELVRKADSVASGIEAALKTDNRQMVEFAVDAASRLDAEEHGKTLVAAFDKALAEHREAKEKADDRSPAKSNEEEIVKVLELGRAKLIQKTAPRKADRK